MPTQREYEDIFKKVFLFSDLINVPEAFDRISAIMERREFSKGDIITQQGQPGNEFFVLVRGQLSVHKNTLEGDDYKVALLESGYPAFGEGGLIDGEVRSATIICDSQAECLVLKKEKFDHLCQAEP
ncbi:MAG: cyclic nucleotide-binding domain-containing protein, partial [Bdellovibrionales bacterium]|nr:cyclic nucleotide-binding domain-containing protein [Bdellovibrionales bacterium]